MMHVCFTTFEPVLTFQEKSSLARAQTSEWKLTALDGHIASIVTYCPSTMLYRRKRTAQADSGTTISHIIKL